MSATTVSSRGFVRAQRRWQNGNPKLLRPDQPTDWPGSVLEMLANLKIGLYPDEIGHPDLIADDSDKNHICPPARTPSLTQFKQLQSPSSSELWTDMIFVNKFTQPQFLAQKIYAKKNRNRDKIKSATKQRKCPKMAILRHLGVEMDN